MIKIIESKMQKMGNVTPDCPQCRTKMEENGMGFICPSCGFKIIIITEKKPEDVDNID